MRYFKYCLFIVFIYFSGILWVHAATCKYGNVSTFYLECTTSSGTYANCSIKGSKADAISFASGTVQTSFTNELYNEDVKSCNKDIYVTIKPGETTSSMIITGIYSNSTNLPSGYQTLSVMKDLSSYNGSSCTFEDSNFKYTCTVRNGSLDCNLSCKSSAIVCSDKVISSSVNSLDVSTFESNGKFVCPDKIYYTYNENDGYWPHIVQNVVSTDVNQGILKSKSETISQGSTLNPNDFNGKRCVFINNVLKYSCEIRNGAPYCAMTCAEGVTCKDNYNIDNVSNKLEMDEFLVTGSFACPSTIYATQPYDKNQKKVIIGEVSTKEGGLTLKYNKNATFVIPGYVTPGENDNVGANYGISDCNSLLGNPKDNVKKPPAFFLQTIFNVMKYVAIIIIIVLSSLDFLTSIAAKDEEKLKKAVSKVITRLIICVAIFVLPTILQVIFTMVDIYSPSICNIG